MSQVPPPPKPPPPNPPQQQLSPQQPPPPPVSTFVKEIPPKAWARTFLIVAVFFGGALIMAGATAGLFTAGMGAATAAVPSEFGVSFGGGSTWIVMTFQLLAMGFLSPLSVGMDFGEFGLQAAGGSLFFVPWLVPVGGIVAVVVTQRFLGGNLRVPRTGTRLFLAGLAGITFATVITMLAAAIRFRFDEGMAMFGGSVWAHAASFPGFFVAALLVGGITYLLLLPQRGPVLQRAMTGGTQVVEHVVILAVIGMIVVLISGLVQGDTETLGFIVAILPTVGLLMASMAHFVPLVATGTEDVVGGMAESEVVHIFDAHPGFWIPGIVIMLLVLGISAFRWSLRTRFHAHATWAWITLPVAYLLVGLLLTFGNGVYFAMFAEGEGIRYSVASAAWGFVIWVVIGAIVQLLAVYVMPYLARRFPAGLVRALGWGLTPGTARGPRKPMSHTTKIVLWSGFGVLVLAAVAWIAHSVLARTVFGPQHTAEAYLDAVVDGRATDALELMEPNVTDQQRVLVTDEVYQAAENRPDRFEIGDIEWRDSQVNDVIVEATIYQEGNAYPVTIGLVESGTQAGIFSGWELRSGDVTGNVVYASGPSELTVNGIDVAIEPAGADALPDASMDELSPEQSDGHPLVERVGQVLLPGTYTFTAPEGSKYLSHGDDVSITITPGEHAETPIEFNQRYTSEFETDVVAHIEQRLESCVADGTIRIEDCEAASWEDTWWEAMTNIERSWNTSPEIELVPADEGPSFGDVDITEHSGPVNARIVDGSIDISYEVRDDEDEDWIERQETYSPFGGGWYDAMELPVTVDGDELSIDFSPLDEYNSSWLSDEFQD